MELDIMRWGKQIKAIYGVSFWILTILIVLSEYIKDHIRWVIFIPLGVFAVASILNSYLKVKENKSKSDMTTLILNMLVIAFIFSVFIII